MKQQKYIRYILLPTTLLCLIASLFVAALPIPGNIQNWDFILIR